LISPRRPGPRWNRRGAAVADSPDPAAVTRLLDLAQQRGFTFTPVGEQGSLWSERVTAQWRDLVFLGASGHCSAPAPARVPSSRVNP
jgi:hypothetical protein